MSFVKRSWRSLTKGVKGIVALLATAAALIGGWLATEELKDRYWNRYDEHVPLTYYGANDFREFLDGRIGEIVKLRTELVMDVMPGIAESMLLNQICDAQATPEETLPSNVFVAAFPEFADGYKEPQDYSYNEAQDSYTFPTSATDYVRCYDSIRIEFKNSEQLRLNHGGTGMASLPINGEFMVERRAFSGPRLEYTLREQ